MDNSGVKMDPGKKRNRRKKRANSPDAAPSTSSFMHNHKSNKGVPKTNYQKPTIPPLMPTSDLRWTHMPRNLIVEPVWPLAAAGPSIGRRVSHPSGGQFEGRKTRPPHPSSSSSCDTSSQTTMLAYSIQPVPRPVTGRFLRVRNPKYKYINVETLLKASNGKPHVIPSKVEVTDLEDDLEKLNISDGGPSKLATKAARRKMEKKAKRERKAKRSGKQQEDDHEEVPFPEFLTLDEVNAGLEDGSLIKGFLRINPKNPRDSYVNNEDRSLADYYITSILDRNRAMEGDQVVIKIKPKHEWIDGKKTVSVVYIKEKVHPRTCVGTIIPFIRKNGYAVMEPRDKRCPRIRIHQTSFPNGFKENPKLFADVLVLAKITDWAITKHAMGAVTEVLGQSGDLKVETISILKEFCLDTMPFEEQVVSDCLPTTLRIPAKEFEYREDIRKECIFTIDPETARDLDDAVSVKSLPNGNYEVGVHISDASFYLHPGTELDQLVCKKATTIYMVNEAFHMLPLELCLFCSLLAGEDKLAFSVFWEMTPEGEVLSKRFSRTIINSCVKLAYEHAQNVIENSDKAFTVDDFPTIYNGFSPADIAGTIKVLQNMAVNMRQKRIEKGALKIDQVKLSFRLDPVSGEPLEFWKYENKESHRLIEEFMLLANISVAEKIYECFPRLAFLRCHEEPKHTMLTDLQSSLASCGIHIDISSSAGISNSMKKYTTTDYAGISRSAVINHLTAKSMTRAKYFCAASREEELDFHHYALSVPIYTHFTSPIRRYADIMVHRLLAASLNYEETPKWAIDYVSSVAQNCNALKYNAKRAGDASCELYLSHYVMNHSPFVEDCVVVDVKERSFDCLVLRTGSIVRIYNNNCEPGTLWTVESIPIVNGGKEDKKLLRVILQFKKTEYPEVTLIVEIFSVVKISLQKKPKSYKLEGVLMRPLPMS